MNVLVSLHRGYGLGDAVMASVLLRHARAAHPEWVMNFQAERGREKVGVGIADNVFAYGDPYTSPHYDAEVLVTLFDKWHGFTDRPNTHVAAALKQHFGLDWRADLGRYSVKVSEAAAKAARILVSPDDGFISKRGRVGHRAVAVHYQGNSARANKDLSDAQAVSVCKQVERLGCTPLLLDWRNTSPIVDSFHIRTTGRVATSCEWGADAEMNCAVISQCAAFVGIDSGPAKCASATDTPALVVWTGHHPAAFHDPAPNTTHLVPCGFHGMRPVGCDPGIVEWFDRNYRVRQYYENNPVPEVNKWLAEVLCGGRLSLAID